MRYQLDPELTPAMAALAARAAGAPAPARGDWQAVRTASAAGLAWMDTLVPAPAGVTTTSITTPTADGEDTIELRWYTTGATPASPGPAVVYAHGGGMIGGTLDLYDKVVGAYTAHTGVPFLSVGYRLAPEATSPASMAEDVFTALTWLASHAAELQVDPARIAVMGDSGGGCPTAGAAILARDRGLPLARQILIYPMLDDRTTTPGPIPREFLTWTYDSNYTGWHCLLGDQTGADSVSPVAAPGRLTDFTRLAPAYLDVGDLDIFRDETMAYAAGLAKAGVPVELHVHPRCPPRLRAIRARSRRLPPRDCRPRPRHPVHLRPPRAAASRPGD